MYLSDNIVQELKGTVLTVFEEYVVGEIDSLVNEAIEKYGQFEREETPELLRELKEAGIPLHLAAKRYREMRAEAAQARHELHELKTSLEQKRHWLPLVQRLRDIFVYEDRHDLASIIDHYIATGQLAE